MNISVTTKPKSIPSRGADVRRAPLGKLSRVGEGHSAASAQLHRVLPGGGDQGLEVAAFGSSI